MTRERAVKEMVEAYDVRTVLVPPRPLTFDEFVDLFGEDDNVELIDGVAVRRMAARDPHEDLNTWLISVLRAYARANDLGIVRGSRTAVQITQHRGRLPDVVFVCKERAGIVQEKGLYGAPDLIIEILSPGDKASDVVALEVDYRSIGTAEIWFIDQERKQVRVLRRGEEGYTEQVLTEGPLQSEVVEGFRLAVTWLFARPLPLELDTLMQLMGGEQ